MRKYCLNYSVSRVRKRPAPPPFHEKQAINHLSTFLAKMVNCTKTAPWSWKFVIYGNQQTQRERYNKSTVIKTVRDILYNIRTYIILTLRVLFIYLSWWVSKLQIEIGLSLINVGDSNLLKQPPTRSVCFAVQSFDGYYKIIFVWFNRAECYRLVRLDNGPIMWKAKGFRDSNRENQSKFAHTKY